MSDSTSVTLEAVYSKMIFLAATITNAASELALINSRVDQLPEQVKQAITTGAERIVSDANGLLTAFNQYLTVVSGSIVVDPGVLPGSAASIALEKCPDSSCGRLRQKKP